MRVAVTGAATGIGAATAARLKDAGYTVVAVDIVEPAHLGESWVPVDLSDPSSIAAAAGQVDGPLDALINVAGLPPRAGLERKVLAVNYFGLIDLTNRLLDRLADGASIVNVASRAGMQWRENIAQVKALMALRGDDDLDAFIDAEGIDPVRAYNLSKEAVIAWTVANSGRFLERGLRANCVSPAAVSTDILDDFRSAFGDRVERSIARVGRAGTVDEIAAVICFLAGPDSHWVKGVDITIDGGMTALATADALGL